MDVVILVIIIFQSQEKMKNKNHINNKSKYYRNHNAKF